MRDVTSFSEIDKLTTCEMQWAYKYRDQQPDRPNAGMVKGTALHKLIARWRAGDDLTTLYQWLELNVELGALTEEDRDTILYVFDRYQRYYRDQPRPRIVAQELRLVSPLPGTDVEVVTYVDEVVQVPGSGLWAVERKTMRDWRRMATLEVDQQVSIVLWQLWQHEWPVHGLLYDAIRTHKFAGTKPTLKVLDDELRVQRPMLSAAERKLEAKKLQLDRVVEEPLDSSFRLEALTRSDQQIESALSEMRKGVLRRAMLGAGLEPMRHIGEHCNRCPFQAQCWLGMAFDTSIVIDDDLDD